MRKVEIKQVELINTKLIINQLEGIFRAHVNISTEMNMLRNSLNKIMSNIYKEVEIGSHQENTHQSTDHS
jgi:hypothetical protein